MSGKLSFSLNKPTPKPTPPSSNKPAFGLADSDDETPPAPPPDTGRSWGRPKPPPAKSVVHQAVAPSRAAREKQEEALQIDQAAFAYDEVYDSMKDAQKAARQRKEDESTDRQVSRRYVCGLCKDMADPCWLFSRNTWLKLLPRLPPGSWIGSGRRKRCWSESGSWKATSLPTRRSSSPRLTKIKW